MKPPTYEGFTLTVCRNLIEALELTTEQADGAREMTPGELLELTPAAPRFLPTPAMRTHTRGAE